MTMMTTTTSDELVITTTTTILTVTKSDVGPILVATAMAEMRATGRSLAFSGQSMAMIATQVVASQSFGEAALASVRSKYLEV